MLKHVGSAIFAATLYTMLAAPPLGAKPRPSGEEQLAKLLEGRLAGKPERCISTFGMGNLQIIDRTAIIYQQGKTIWVNRTGNPKSLDRDDVLVIRRYGGNELCRLDDVRAVGRTSGMLRALVRLEDFIPYTKVAKARN